MKKLLLTLLVIVFSLDLVKGQTNDSLLNEYNKLNKKINHIDLKLNQFVLARNQARGIIITGIILSSLGSYLIIKNSDSESDSELGKILIYGGTGISFIGAIKFHLSDKKLRLTI